MTVKTTRDIQELNRKKFFEGAGNLGLFATGTWTVSPEGVKFEGEWRSDFFTYNEKGVIIGRQWFDENGQRAFESYDDDEYAWMKDGCTN